MIEDNIIIFHLLGSFFGFRISNFNICWGFQKKEYVFGYEDFVDFFFFLESSQNWIIFRGHFYAFYGNFLRSRYRMRETIFGVAKISNIFLGCLKFLIFFGVNGKRWARAYI